MPSSIHKVAKESETSGKLMKRASLSMSSPYEELTLESPITPIVGVAHFYQYFVLLSDWI